ncbi:response regulator [Sphingomonas sp. AR_OL41]|uniref:response regulator n=1 Tax=Sphingomonas sp. AR_OL41 TaxID=3042729 RepID=UPI002480B58D|nr:response regulator [Sphingomonas sp. AR_OL41]MDH7972712.1 response regulator [Sphingomonas sp. AR_OL41]
MDATASILLVEDARPLSEALRRTLQERGYAVTIASDGNEACALLAAPDSVFTALITDLDLGPGPNGWDVARAARTRNADVVVIYVTGGDGSEWAAVGVPKSLILQKPFTAAQIVRAMNGFDEGLARDAAASNLEEIAALHMRLDTVEEANRRLDDAAQAETLRRSRELLEDVKALAEARAKAAAVEAELAAREAAITQLADTNRKLVANEAMLGKIVEQHTVALTREMEERRLAEQGGERAIPDDEPAVRAEVAAPRKTILLVEDNLLLADITAALFKQLDYDTVPAANARDALTLLEAGAKVDAVFCDVVMPGEMNGVALARLLEQDYPGLPVTLTTGYGDLPAGNPPPAGVEVLSKPYRLDDLEAALERALGGSVVAAAG